MAKQSTQPELPMKDVTPPKTKGGLRPATNAKPTGTPPKGGSSGQSPAKIGKVITRERTRGGGKAVAVVKPKTSDDGDILALVATLSANKDVDAVKTKALLEIVLGEQDRRNEIEFERAKLAAQMEMPPITKDSWNDHTKSTWARLEKISAVADPIIHKHGFSLSFSNEDCPIPDHYRIKCVVSHTPTGFKKSIWMDVGMDHLGAKGGGTKSLAQGSGSSQTYGRRFLKINFFDLNVTGLDRDGNPLPTLGRPAGPRASGDAPLDKPVKKITEKQAETLRDTMEACGVSVKAFTDFYGVKVADLPADLYEAAIKHCKEYAERKAAQNGR